MLRRNLDDEVYDILLQQIMDGEYSAGEKIRVEDLSESLDVSITPVLGALRKLVYDGLVVSKRGNGFFVASYSKDDCAQILEVLNHMFMIGLDAILCSPDKDTILKDLRKQSDRAMTLYRSGDYRAYQKADNRFHESIIRCAENRYLLNYYNDAYRKICFCFQLSLVSAERGLNTARPDNHFKLCDALEKGDRTALLQILLSDFPIDHYREAGV